MPSPSRRVVLLLGLLAMLLVLSPVTVGATPTWCRQDPIIRIEGKKLHIYVFAEERILNPVLGARGETLVRISVPPGTRTEFIRQDDGFLDFGYDVQWVEDDRLETIRDAVSGLAAAPSAVEVRVSVRVPAYSSDLAVGVEVTDRDDVQLHDSAIRGRTNEMVSVRFVLALPRR